MKRQHGEVQTGAAAASCSTVLCCGCGVPMVPNETMRCAQCLKTELCIVDGISRNVALPRCKNCARYNRPPFMKVEPESRELLGICLKRIKGLGKEVRLVDASFIWTEEHSMRLKVKLTVQKEVAANSVLQQTCVVEFTIVSEQCPECQKSFTPHEWNAIVQVRQKVPHRRTLILLEQHILKHNAHEKVLSLMQTPEGLDFHFGQRSHAQRFSDFVSSCCPQRAKLSKQLISHDQNSNLYAYKYTILCELCPVVVDDLVYIPKNHTQALSGASPFMLCNKVSTALRLTDPLTLRTYDVPADSYFKRPFSTVLSRGNLTDFMVLNIEMLDQDHERQSQGSKSTPARLHVAGKGRLAIGDVEVARMRDFGVNDERHIVRSHLAGILKPGNQVLGYDLRFINVSGIDAPELGRMPTDFVLVKKQWSKRSRFNWELLRMNTRRDPGMKDAPDDGGDVEAVMRDLEEDAELRKGVNMFARGGQTGQQNAPKAGKAAAAAAASSGKEVKKEDGEDMGEEDEDEDDAAPLVPEDELIDLLEGLTMQEEADE